MIENEYQLVREALVREIRDAKRWSVVVEAWEALLSVKQQAKSLINEQPNKPVHPTQGGMA